MKDLNNDIMITTHNSLWSSLRDSVGRCVTGPACLPIHINVCTMVNISVCDSVQQSIENNI